jgi:hypothetical protein
LKGQSAEAKKAAGVLEVILGKTMSLYSESDEAVESSSPNQHTKSDIGHAAYKRLTPQGMYTSFALIANYPFLCILKSDRVTFNRSDITDWTYS